MAEVKKPGRPKAYTAAQLERAIEAYFNSISYEEPVEKRVPALDENGNTQLDDKGHIVYKFEQIKTKDGNPATVTRWIEPPGIMSLCLYLGIDSTTFERYGKSPGEDSESERFRRTITRARGRVEAYLSTQLENGKAARGAIFNLQQNFGWKDRKEISLDKNTRDAMTSVKTMTMAERMELLKSVGDLPELTEDE